MEIMIKYVEKVAICLWYMVMIQLCLSGKPVPNKTCLMESDWLQFNNAYRGTINHTAKGVLCQKWALQTPKTHNYNILRRREFHLEANYCRNPDKSNGPWCYTAVEDLDTPHWDYCYIPLCPEPNVNCIPKSGTYTGDWNKVVDGKTTRSCMSWAESGYPFHQDDGNSCRKVQGSKPNALMPNIDGIFVVCAIASHQLKDCGIRTCAEDAWGEWQDTKCSVSCGEAGVMIRERQCGQPYGGGEGCVGSRTDEKTCQMYCPSESNPTIEDVSYLPFKKYYLIGDNLALLCSGSLGFPPAKLVWMQLLKGKSYWLPISGANDYTFKHTDKSGIEHGEVTFKITLQQKHNGSRVRCDMDRAQGSFKSASRRLRIRRPEPVSKMSMYITSREKDGLFEQRVFTVGNVVLLTCIAPGMPPPTVFWLNEKDKTVSVKSVYIWEVTKNDIGDHQFTCEASNAVDGDTITARKVCTITVEESMTSTVVAVAVIVCVCLFTWAIALYVCHAHHSGQGVAQTVSDDAKRAYNTIKNHTPQCLQGDSSCDSSEGSAQQAETGISTAENFAVSQM